MNGTVNDLLASVVVAILEMEQANRCFTGLSIFVTVSVPLNFFKISPVA